VPEIKKPLISDSATLSPLVLKDSFVYDIETKVGEEIVLTAQ